MVGWCAPLGAFSVFVRFLGVQARQRQRRLHPLRRCHHRRAPRIRDKACRNKSSKKGHSDSYDVEIGDVIQVDYAFFDPKPGDFHGVKILLQRFIDCKHWHLTGFVDVILNQTRVGTIVKIENAVDDFPFALISVLNIGYHKSQPCIVELKEFLSHVSQGSPVKDHLQTMLESQAQDVGLLISERAVELPLQLLPPFYDSLFDEILWATEDEPTKELRDSYQNLSSIFMSLKSNKNTDGFKNTEQFAYTKPEDEIFSRISPWSFTFPWEATPTKIKHVEINQVRRDIQTLMT